MFDTDTIEMDERQGLPSASGMQRLFLCPGSWNAERKCPVDEESDDAALGTMLHAHMEQGTMPEDSEDAEAVAWCHEMEIYLCEKHLGMKKDWTDVQTLRETRLFERDRLFSGKPDMVAVWDRKAFVVDYKFGDRETARHRKQIREYLRLLRQMGYTRTEGYLWYVRLGRTERVEEKED